MTRLLQRAMPDLSQIAKEVAWSQSLAAQVNQIYGSRYLKMIESVQAALPKIQVPLVTMPKIEIPALKLDYSALFPDIKAIQQRLAESVFPAVRIIQDLQRDQFAGIIETAQRAMAAMLPPNWRDSDVHLPANLEVLLLDEGLALAWIPPAPVLTKLFQATSAGERREVIRTHWRSISSACINELSSIESPGLAEHVEFALEAAQVFRSGRHRSAQALSANLLDTILRENFDSKDRKSITGQKVRMDIDEYPVRVAIVLGGIWGSFGEFWPSQGDKVPRRFSRHGSAHGVSRRQYSRTNSLLALMHVVSLLRLLDTDLRQDSSH